MKKLVVLLAILLDGVMIGLMMGLLLSTEQRLKLSQQFADVIGRMTEQLPDE